MRGRELNPQLTKVMARCESDWMRERVEQVAAETRARLQEAVTVLRDDSRWPQPDWDGARARAAAQLELLTLN